MIHLFISDFKLLFMNKIGIVFISVFLCLIFTPLFLTMIRVKVVPKNKLEKPIVLNFKRNFPLKEDLFDFYAFVKEEIFNVEIVPNLVIKGVDNWKFMGNHYGDCFSESIGLKIFSDEQLSKIRENILNQKKWLKTQGINLIISIAPNKLTVYGDKIDIPRGKITKFEQLSNLCKELDICVLNLGDEFECIHNENLYLQTDSHWNLSLIHI